MKQSYTQIRIKTANSVLHEQGWGEGVCFREDEDKTSRAQSRRLRQRPFRWEPSSWPTLLDRWEWWLTRTTNSVCMKNCRFYALSWCITLTSTTTRRVALLLHIQEVTGSNLGTQTGYPDSSLRDFLTSSRQRPRWYLKSGHDPLLTHSIIRRHRPTVWATDNVVKYTINEIKLISIEHRGVVVSTSAPSSEILDSSLDQETGATLTKAFHDFLSLSWKTLASLLNT
jgi:hypothetical protein